jgi:hypothetical protein
VTLERYLALVSLSFLAIDSNDKKYADYVQIAGISAHQRNKVDVVNVAWEFRARDVFENAE